ncbi:hypothetical protein FB45DRAFT_823248 [Roridomyces roridus]|uniref:Acyl-coenzyme A oxidase n=1 Tax=Roridomyces roridus TaxID=1738132 RepID=A0AAD7CGT2_9AGAR|nr:hypothetical protein FB45DRAFT_823248 [Roridomyces roridus]
MPNRQIQLMQNARSQASFHSQELTNIIYGGATAVQSRREEFSRIEKVLGRSDTRKLPEIYWESGRTEQYVDGLQWGAATFRERLKRGNSLFDYVSPHLWMNNASPFGLHFLMFTPALKLLASPEQLEYWLPLAESGRIIGTYCQTELGHGTFVRGLETTATFDETTDEFVVHSPTTSSTKFWPGGLGYSASHAIVMARLVIKSKDYGMHPFMVQLRSLEDYTPTPGIELGDIGLKLGHNTADNGYAVFTHLRIPRTQLLMRSNQVLRDGTYIRGPNDKLAYSTMLFARKVFIVHIYLQLAQAATIAIRYSVVREQGNVAFNVAENTEMPIIAFKLQQYRLFTLMARAFALHFAGVHVSALYEGMLEGQKSGDENELAPVHALLAGMKAYSTQVTADGAEDARKCCGGHGYLAMSGFGQLVPTATAIATLEGENFVMYQQTARFLVKCLARPEQHCTTEYLRSPGKFAFSTLAPDADFLHANVQLEMFRHRSARLAVKCAEALSTSQKRDGLSSAQAWNKHMLSLIALARAHTETFVLAAFVDAVQGIKDDAVRAVLQRLCSLFALSSIDGPNGAEFFADGYIAASHLKHIRATIEDLLQALLPDAVALTDAWDFTDTCLASALGCADGDVYERIMEWTRQVPLNVEARKMGGVFRPGFEEHIKPILRGKL